jgi:hypothetical protein
MSTPSSSLADPSSVARSVERLAEVLQIAGNYRRFPVPPDASSGPLEISFAQADPGVERDPTGDVAIHLAFRCVVGTAAAQQAINLPTPSSEPPFPGLLFFAEAAFVVVYKLRPGSAFTPAELDAFARINGPLNVVPYWREFLHSAALRAGIPSVLAPVHRTEPSLSSVQA